MGAPGMSRRYERGVNCCSTSLLCMSSSTALTADAAEAVAAPRPATSWMRPMREEGMELTPADCGAATPAAVEAVDCATQVAMSLAALEIRYAGAQAPPLSTSVPPSIASFTVPSGSEWPCHVASLPMCTADVTLRESNPRWTICQRRDMATPFSAADDARLASSSRLRLRIIPAWMPPP